MPISTLLVDDEPLARELLREMLSTHADFVVAGECRNGAEAVDRITVTRPDLVLLDVQMPELNGFEVIEAIGVQRMPYTVFVTAYDRYALKAFEVQALDYLLKPFDEARFSRTLQRVRDRWRHPHEQFQTQLRALLSRRESSPQRLAIHDAGTTTFVPLAEIDWLEAAGKYIVVHVEKTEHLLRDSMTALEDRLDATRFVRIHRSSIVQIDRIREIRTTFGGEYTVILRNGTQLSTGRSYRSRVQALLGKG